MYKRVAILVSFLLAIASTSFAQETTTPKILPVGVQCDDIETMFSTIAKYDEKPLFTGNGMLTLLNGQVVQGGVMFFVNQNTGSFSYVQVFGDGMSCMLSIGGEFSPYSQGMVANRE